MLYIRLVTPYNNIPSSSIVIKERSFLSVQLQFQYQLRSFKKAEN